MTRTENKIVDGDTSGISVRWAKKRSRSTEKRLKRASTPVELQSADPAVISQYAAIATATGNVSQVRNMCETHVAEQCQHALGARSAEVGEIRAEISKDAFDLSEDKKRLRRVLAAGPFDPPAPWNLAHRLEAGLALVLCGTAAPLSFYTIRYFTESAGILPPDKSWVVASGSILAVALLESALAFLPTTQEKQKYARQLFRAGILAWVLFLACFAYVTRGLLSSPTLGVTQQSSVWNDLITTIQIGTQIAGEILTSSALLIRLVLLLDLHKSCPHRRRTVRQYEAVCSLLTEFSELVALIDRLTAADAAAVTIKTQQAIRVFDYLVVTAPGAAAQLGDSSSPGAGGRNGDEITVTNGG